MKYQKLFIRYMPMLLMLLCAVSWQSCKKPVYQFEDQESYSRIFMQLASNGVVEKSLPIKDEWIAFPFGAGYGGPVNLAENVKVGFEIAQDQVDQYNQQNNTNYELPPAGSYRLDNSTVEIPSGKTGSNSISVEVNPLKLNGTKAYLIPIRISSVSADIPVIEELKTTYFIVKGFYEANPYQPISKTDWEIVEVSSDQADGVGGLAKYCIDGDVNTCWLSKYSKVNNVRPVHPHHVTIDMKDMKTLHALQIFGRITQEGKSSQDYLFPRTLHIEVSNDGENWESAGIFSTVTTPAGAPEATMYFEKAVQGRYLRVTVLSSTSANGDTTGIAEINAY
ncbi:MAG: DUF1735 domain-containing protein [Niabella sp.]